MSGVDVKRRVRARLPADPEAFDAREPGEMIPAKASDGSVAGYLYCCPGCGVESYVPLSGDGPRWSVVGGDPRDPSTLTLTPSLWHREATCGWHGWLRDGELVPC